MNIRRQLAYTENARYRLRETLAAQPQTLDVAFETTAAHKTVGQLVAHLVGAEKRWTLGRLYGEGTPMRYEDAAAETLGGLFADWDEIRTRTLEFSARADAAMLGRVITTDLPQWGRTVRVTAEEVLLHLCNHQTWHMGQISMALQRLGVDPPNFDYVFLRDEGEPEEAGAGDYVVNVEGVIWDGDRCLMALRSEQEAHAGGTLAFPGGKAEGTDLVGALEETLRREIREEVGVEVADFVYVESHTFGQARRVWTSSSPAAMPAARLGPWTPPR